MSGPGGIAAAVRDIKSIKRIYRSSHGTGRPWMVELELCDPTKSPVQLTAKDVLGISIGGGNKEILAALLNDYIKRYPECDMPKFFYDIKGVKNTVGQIWQDNEGAEGYLGGSAAEPGAVGSAEANARQATASTKEASVRVHHPLRPTAPTPSPCPRKAPGTYGGNQETPGTSVPTSSIADCGGLPPIPPPPPLPNSPDAHPPGNLRASPGVHQSTQCSNTNNGACNATPCDQIDQQSLSVDGIASAESIHEAPENSSDNGKDDTIRSLPTIPTTTNRDPQAVRGSAGVMTAGALHGSVAYEEQEGGGEDTLLKRGDSYSGKQPVAPFHRGHGVVADPNPYAHVETPVLPLARLPPTSYVQVLQPRWEDGKEGFLSESSNGFVTSVATGVGSTNQLLATPGGSIKNVRSLEAEDRLRHRLINNSGSGSGSGGSSNSSGGGFSGPFSRPPLVPSSFTRTPATAWLPAHFVTPFTIPPPVPSLGGSASSSSSYQAEQHAPRAAAAATAPAMPAESQLRRLRAARSTFTGTRAPPNTSCSPSDSTPMPRVPPSGLSNASHYARSGPVHSATRAIENQAGHSSEDSQRWGEGPTLAFQPPNVFVTDSTSKDDSCDMPLDISNDSILSRIRARRGGSSNGEQHG